MRYKLYEAWGMLGKEHIPQYSDMIPSTDHYDVITVEIPDEYPLAENEFGETLIDIDGETYLLAQVLASHNDEPCLRWFDGRKYHRIDLKTV